MAQKVYTPDLGNTELEIQPHVTLPDVSEGIQQTLARLMAFDKLNSTFRLLRATLFGALRITPSIHEYERVVTNRYDLILNQIVEWARNDTRSWIVFYNKGPNTVYVDLSSTNNLNNALPLPPHSMLKVDVYTGPVRLNARDGAVTVVVHDLAVPQ